MAAGVASNVARVARAEGRISAGDDHAARGRIMPGVDEGGRQLVIGPAVQRIAPLRPIEGDARDILRRFIGDAGEIVGMDLALGHGVSSVFSLPHS